MGEELLPCPTPWCRREDTPHTWQGCDDKWCVTCPSCNVTGPPSLTEREAVERWNTRKADERVYALEAGFSAAISALRTVGDDYPGSSCQKWCQDRAREAEAIAAWSTRTPPAPEGEDVVYEVWQDNAFGDGVPGMVAGSTSLADAQHYAAVYGQDAPTKVMVVTRRPLSQRPAPQAGSGLADELEQCKVGRQRFEHFDSRKLSVDYLVPEDLFNRILAALRTPAEPVGDEVERVASMRERARMLCGLHKKMLDAVRRERPYPVSIAVGDDDTLVVLSAAIELEHGANSLAALSSTPERGWQPIETNPPPKTERDTTYFVVWGPHLPAGMIVSYEASRFWATRHISYPAHLSSRCFTHWRMIETPDIALTTEAKDG